MTSTAPLERLTPSDRFLLWDDYGWSSDIGALAILDGAALVDTDGRVRLETLRHHIESRLHLIPRFRQVLSRPRRGFGWPLWVDAPAFDIRDHVRTREVKAPLGDQELFDVCEDLMRRPFRPDRPLWELWLISGLTDSRLAAILKVHHVVADGTAALAAFAALLDDHPAPTAASAAPPWHPTPPPTNEQLFDDNLRRRRAELRRAGSGLTHPARTVRQAREALPAWREVLTDKPAPPTSLNQSVGGDRRLGVVRASLDDAKRAAKDNDAKVNDVILAVVAGGLRELLAGRGELADGLTQRAMVTIAHDQSGQTQGNKPGWMMVDLPLDEPDTRRRLQQIAVQTAARKQQARPEAGSGVFRFMAAQRLWYRVFPRQRSVNIVVSNVAGPSFPVYLAGAQLLDLVPLMPTMGNLTLVVAALSYVGRLNIGAVGDRDRCPDLDVFTRGVLAALDQLATTQVTPVP